MKENFPIFNYETFKRWLREYEEKERENQHKD